MDYQSYLQGKFQWTTATASTIDWQIHALAQRQLKQTEKFTISKFIHEWLPLQDQYHVHSTSASNLCPSCQQSMETVDHFIQCPHSDQQAIWTNMYNSLYKIHLQQQAPLHCYNALAYGLYRGCNAQPPNLNVTGMDSQKLVTEQSQIGWMQLYYGRFSTAWACVLNSKQTMLNGINFYSKVITIMWTAVLSQWGQCNSHLHPPNPIQDDRTQLQNQVYQILMIEAQSDPLLQDLVNTCNLEVCMRRPTKYIRQWINNSQNHILAQRSKNSNITSSMSHKRYPQLLCSHPTKNNSN